MKVLVAGGGGFIGGHLVKSLLADGYAVRSVDVKPLEEWWQVHDGAENLGETDLQRRNACFDTTEGVDEIYNLAADMGGMGFIENNKAACMLSVLIGTQMRLFSFEWGAAGSDRLGWGGVAVRVTAPGVEQDL